MSKERFAERKAEPQNTIKRLREAVAQPGSDLVRDAVIQRFEFTFRNPSGKASNFILNGRDWIVVRRVQPSRKLLRKD